MPRGPVSACVCSSRVSGRNGVRCEGERFAGAADTGGLTGSGLEEPAAGAGLEADAAGSLSPCAAPSGETSADDSASSPS